MAMNEPATESSLPPSKFGTYYNGGQDAKFSHLQRVKPLSRFCQEPGFWPPESGLSRLGSHVISESRLQRKHP